MVLLPFLGLVLAARMAFLTPFLVDGPSMEPTLQDGQIFILDQKAYEAALPQRGDVVVFSADEEPDYFYVKRVIGLPGERVSVKTQSIDITDVNGKTFTLDESYLKDVAQLEKALYTYKPGFVQHYVVPADKYFVLGDNRLHSLDSRSFRQPFIAKNRLKGKYILTLLSL